MEIETRILTLAAKKIANEATAKESAALRDLLLQNPDICQSLKNIFSTWDLVSFDHSLSEKQIEENLAAVLANIHKRINTPI